jgi:hypothetical protein
MFVFLEASTLIFNHIEVEIIVTHAEIVTQGEMVSQGPGGLK